MKALKLSIVWDAALVQPPEWNENDPAVQVRRNPDGSIWAYSYEHGSERWMHLPGLASFRLGSSSEEAIVVPEPDAAPMAPDHLEDMFQRSVSPMALQANGSEVIHASAVITAEGVLAFCGRSQTGKSTVAYGLHRRGYNVWADDTLVFDASGDHVHAIPFPHRVRIRPEAADHFDLDELRRTDESSWTDLEQAQEDPASFGCIFLLERDPAAIAPVEKIRLKPAEALAGVVEHGYWFRLDDSERTRAMVEQYFALVTKVPVFRIRFRPGLEHLPELLDQALAAARTPGAA